MAATTFVGAGRIPEAGLAHETSAETWCVRRRPSHCLDHSLTLVVRACRMVGQLYHCLKPGTTYDESLAFGALPTEAVVTAA
ncbi:hypothetical protein ABZ654_00650 [Streptomyces hygroscopicus]|uniref:hypothetical protein n=1 Tax=Streptomyces TaxID=1883 RepID=UPI000A57825D|nr:MULTISPECIES: hypothetical protein [unclassified Streptomyces]MCO8306620.1 hypothetical protein [Streptomyces sp. RKCA744]